MVTPSVLSIGGVFILFSKNIILVLTIVCDTQYNAIIQYERYILALSLGEAG